MNTNLSELISGEHLNWIQVDVIKKISPTQFIIGDGSTVAVLDIPEDSEYEDKIEVGKGVKLIKPALIAENVIICHPNFWPLFTPLKESIIWQQLFKFFKAFCYKILIFSSKY